MYFRLCEFGLHYSVEKNMSFFQVIPAHVSNPTASHTTLCLIRQVCYTTIEKSSIKAHSSTVLHYFDWLKIYLVPFMETPLFFSEKSESSAQKQHIHSFMEVEKTYSYRMLKEYASECNCV